MTERRISRPDGPDWYVICLLGHLSPRWGARFDGMTLTRTGEGTTVIEGPVVDQAALHGLLRTVGDLGLPLVSIASGHRGPPLHAPSRTTDHQES